VPTTQISLLREHTERIKPPRALWVPFDFGRPLGAARDSAFQTRVLLAALKLLEAPLGPVLSDFPEDATEDAVGSLPLACPVSFARVASGSDDDAVAEVFQQEMRELRPAYDAAREKSGRTTVGASGLTPEQIGGYVAAFLNAELPESLRPDIAALPLFKLAIEDLKAYYLEALAGQAHAVSHKVVGDWFWRETTAAKVLFRIQERWRDSDNPQLQEFSRLRIVPRGRTKLPL
jgi:hypothetical protein